MSAPPPTQQSATEITQRWDKCAARFIVNSGIGLATGVALSAVLFKRRLWPVPLSVGFAAGMAYEECRRSFSAEATVIGGRLKRVVKEPLVVATGPEPNTSTVVATQHATTDDKRAVIS